MVAHLVPRPVGINDDNLEVGTEEGQVVIAAVPDDDVGFLLGLAQDGLIIDAGEDDRATLDVRFVLLTLLDGAVGTIHIGVGGKALHGLGGEIAIRHGVAHSDHTLIAQLALQNIEHLARGLALAAAGAHGADGDDRPRRRQHGAARAE